mmetsp:Transcript_11660/g.49056  ORF Transcript_11660/g.49056 Transcript_11660/m.49056 type:complete len:369 (-) Transcript_11660:1720-2826(-)
MIVGTQQRRRRAAGLTPRARALLLRGLRRVLVPSAALSSSRRRHEHFVLSVTTRCIALLIELHNVTVFVDESVLGVIIYDIGEEAAQQADVFGRHLRREPLPMPDACLEVALPVAERDGPALAPDRANAPTPHLADETPRNGENAESRAELGYRLGTCRSFLHDVTLLLLTTQLARSPHGTRDVVRVCTGVPTTVTAVIVSGPATSRPVGACFIDRLGDGADFGRRDANSRSGCFYDGTSDTRRGSPRPHDGPRTASPRARVSPPATGGQSPPSHPRGARRLHAKILRRAARRGAGFLRANGGRREGDWGVTGRQWPGERPERVARLCVGHHEGGASRGACRRCRRRNSRCGCSHRVARSQRRRRGDR